MSNPTVAVCVSTVANINSLPIGVAADEGA
jgi:hypothetical protein